MKTGVEKMLGVVDSRVRIEEEKLAATALAVILRITRKEPFFA